METITVELRKTHQVVQKVLKELKVGGARFPDVLKTLRRTVSAHAWFVEKILLPALKNVPIIDNLFIQQIIQEHKDVDHLITTLRKMSLSRNKELDAYTLQTEILLGTHFTKESEGLYLLVEENLDSGMLQKLSEEMDRRKEEVRELVEK